MIEKCVLCSSTIESCSKTILSCSNNCCTFFVNLSETNESIITYINFIVKDLNYDILLSKNEDEDNYYFEQRGSIYYFDFKLENDFKIENLNQEEIINKCKLLLTFS